jgi:hypothetical protein
LLRHPVVSGDIPAEAAGLLHSPADQPGDAEIGLAKAPPRAEQLETVVSVPDLPLWICQAAGEARDHLLCAVIIYRLSKGEQGLLNCEAIKQHQMSKRSSLA